MLIDEDPYEQAARKAFEVYLKNTLGCSDFRFSRIHKNQRPDYTLDFYGSQIGVEVTSVWNQNELKTGTFVPAIALTKKLKRVLQNAEQKARGTGCLSRSYVVCFTTLFGLDGIEEHNLVDAVVNEIIRIQTDFPHEAKPVSKYSRMFDLQQLSESNAECRLWYSESSAIADKVIPDVVWGAVNRAVQAKEEKYSNLPESERPIILLYDMTKWSDNTTYGTIPDGQRLSGYFSDVFVIRCETVIPLAMCRIKPV